MYKIESLAEINKAGYNNAVKLATLSIDKIERLAKLNLSTAKTAFADGVENASAIAGVKDVPSLLALNAELTEAGVQSVLGYSRGVYGIASEAQSEFSALAEEAWAAYSKEVARFADASMRAATANIAKAATSYKKAA
jgi:phasin family protein